MRRVEIDQEFALLLSRLRALARRERWRQAPGDGVPTPLRLVEIEAIEQSLGFLLPDPAIAYVAAGVSCWGDGPVRLAALLEKTLLVQEDRGEEGRGSELAAHRFVVIDDDSNGNYIAVKKGTTRESDRVYFLDHEENFVLRSPLSLTRKLADALEKYDAPAEGVPFVAELNYEAAPAPPAIIARHSKFGVGRVVADDGEHVTIAFESVGEKRLKRSFVTFG